MLPASIRKLDEDSGDSQESSNEWEPEEPEGFQFIDIAALAEVFCSLWCPLCRYGRIVFEEDQNSKKGFATLLLKCASSKYKYSSSFYSSSKVDAGQAFEVNRRVVLASRNIGVGHQGLAKFAGVMNMLPPMNENSYRDHVSAVCNAAQTVATKSMTDAAEEAKQFYEPETDGIFNIGVSGDGTWRRRGYSSAYGVVAALSTVTGKALGNGVDVLPTTLETQQFLPLLSIPCILCTPLTSLPHQALSQSLLTRLQQPHMPMSSHVSSRSHLQTLQY